MGNKVNSRCHSKLSDTGTGIPLMESIVNAGDSRSRFSYRHNESAERTDWSASCTRGPFRRLVNAVHLVSVSGHRLTWTTYTWDICLAAQGLALSFGQGNLTKRMGLPDPCQRIKCKHG